MKKRGFTVVEVLIASGIFAFIVTLGMAMIALMSGTLFTGQIESTNRSDLNDTVYYITREIQSAEGIKIENGGKKLSIKQSGDDGYRLVYELKEDYPTDALCFQGKKLMDVSYTESSFYAEGNSIYITLAVLKNDTEPDQSPKIVKLCVTPRMKGVIAA